MPKPSSTSYPSYFTKYIDQVAEDDLTSAFKNQLPGLQTFLNSISEDKANYAYAAGKWTLKEVLQHIIDTERIFAFRSLCFARGEQQSLPGFEENDYAANSNANQRNWESLVEEFLAVRHTTEILFNSFSKDTLSNSGKANNNAATVESMGFTLIGHVNHHVGVMKERYF